jgi:hypothetical protein
MCRLDVRLAEVCEYAQSGGGVAHQPPIKNVLSLRDGKDLGYRDHGLLLK